MYITTQRRFILLRPATQHVDLSGKRSLPAFGK
jgi:hypothetical protein